LEDCVVRGISHRKKQYVEVVALFDEEGTVIPLAVTWEDGHRYEIDEILDKRQARSLKVGGNGVRYLVRIGHTETYLFYEEPRWFVEAKVEEISA
jgi:hypothetical protein